MIQYAMSHIDPMQIVSIYCDRDNPASHLTGFVHELSEEYVLIRHVNPDGLYDGFVLVRQEDVFRVDYGGKYEQKVQALYNIKKQTHPELPNDTSLYSSLLGFCNAHQLVISVELEDTIVSGFIVLFDYDYIHLQVLDEYGTNNGEMILDTCHIISLAVDTSTEHNILILHFNKETTKI